MIQGGQLTKLREEHFNKLGQLFDLMNQDGQYANEST